MGNALSCSCILVIHTIKVVYYQIPFIILRFYFYIMPYFPNAMHNGTFDKNSVSLCFPRHTSSLQEQMKQDVQLNSPL